MAFIQAKNIPAHSIKMMQTKQNMTGLRITMNQLRSAQTKIFNNQASKLNRFRKKKNICLPRHRKVWFQLMMSLSCCWYCQMILFQMRVLLRTRYIPIHCLHTSRRSPEFIKGEGTYVYMNTIVFHFPSGTIRAKDRTEYILSSVYRYKK